MRSSVLCLAQSGSRVSPVSFDAGSQFIGVVPFSAGSQFSAVPFSVGPQFGVVPFSAGSPFSAVKIDCHGPVLQSVALSYPGNVQRGPLQCGCCHVAKAPP